MFANVVIEALSSVHSDGRVRGPLIGRACRVVSSSLSFLCAMVVDDGRSIDRSAKKKNHPPRSPVTLQSWLFSFRLRDEPWPDGTNESSGGGRRMRFRNADPQSGYTLRRATPLACLSFDERAVFLPASVALPPPSKQQQQIRSSLSLSVSPVFHLGGATRYDQTKQNQTMSSNANNPRIIPLEEGWNDEIKAKVSIVSGGDDRFLFLFSPHPRRPRRRGCRSGSLPLSPGLCSSWVT